MWAVLWAFAAWGAKPTIPTEKLDVDGDGKKEIRTTEVHDDGMRRVERVCIDPKKGETCIDRVVPRFGDFKAYKITGDAKWFDVPCTLDARDPTDPAQTALIGLADTWVDGEPVPQTVVCFDAAAYPEAFDKTVPKASPAGWILAARAPWFGTEPTPATGTTHARYAVATLGPMVVLIDTRKKRHRWFGDWQGEPPYYVSFEDDTLKIERKGDGVEIVPLEVDVNSDGADDLDWTVAIEGGTKRCRRDGATGHEACVNTLNDGRFHIQDPDPDSAENVATQAMLEPCETLDPNDPSHGAARLLSTREIGNWQDGPVPRQKAVCVEQGAWTTRYEGGEPEGLETRTPEVLFYQAAGAVAVQREQQHLWTHGVYDNPLTAGELDAGRVNLYDGDRMIFSTRVPTDIDGDGVMDPILTEYEGGSGWGLGTRCITHGASGHMACEETATTAYARFFGFRTFPTEPATDNQALPLFENRCEETADPKKAAHGSLWALATEHDDVWFSGRPVDQQSACLTPTQWHRFPGSLTWHEEAGRPDPEVWTAFYTAAWNDPKSGRQTRTPTMALSNEAYEVWTYAHSVAVYEVARDRHKWFVNLERSVGGGHKLDRWETISEVKLDGSTLLVTYKGYADDETKTVRAAIR